MADGPVLLWDFDGTLGARNGRWSTAIQAAASEAGYPDISLERIRSGLKSGFPWHTPEVGHTYQSADDWWHDLYPVIESAALGAGVRAADVHTVARVTRHHFLDPSTWRLYDDSISALSLAEDLGWRNAILSNHVPELQDIIDELDIAGLFERIFTSAVVGWEKPNRRAFEHARTELGSPLQLAMIGDSLVADFEGATALGLPAIHIKRQFDDDHVLCDAVQRLTERVMGGRQQCKHPR